jgi:hypothetical protein
LSTHAIGTVRLLIGSLVLMLAGAGVLWITGATAAPTALVISGGALEVEPWNGALRTQGNEVYWDHAVAGAFVSVYKAQERDQEYELGEPLPLSGVKTIRIDLRVDGRIIDQAMMITVNAEDVKIAVKDVALSKRGDVWVHPGFVQDGRRKLFEIATVELLGATGQVLQRYQNPDMGRYFRYRIKLTAAAK